MRFGISCALALALALASDALAAKLVIDAKVTRTLASEDAKFGGCMAYLSVSPGGEGLDCPSGNWVTFSCTGKHVSKAAALRMFDSAQLAFVGGYNVRVTVDDSRKHNTWCLVERIDVLAGP